jgi:hypothetical protein
VGRKKLGRVREMLIFTDPHKFSGEKERAKRETALKTDVVGKHTLNRSGQLAAANTRTTSTSGAAVCQYLCK